MINSMGGEMGGEDSTLSLSGKKVLGIWEKIWGSGKKPDLNALAQGTWAGGFVVYYLF